MTTGGVPTTALEGALDARRRGWRPVPIPSAQKAPVLPDWPSYAPSDEQLRRDFGGDVNVGIILGEPSGGLIDVDCDTPESCFLAERWLPPTNLVHGRPAKRMSHFWFLAEGVGRVERFNDPDSKAGEKTLIELRGSGGQTVIPPSVHPSGEFYEWVSFGAPGRVNRDDLRSCVMRIAAGSAIARRWPEGARHDAALAMAGFLLRRGMAAADARDFVGGVASAAGDREVSDRIEAVRTTEKKLGGGERAVGGPKAAAIFGSKVLDRVVEWLGLLHDRNRGNLPIIPTRGRPFRDISTDALEALRKANDPPVLFARSGSIVAVAEDEKGGRSLRPLSEAGLRAHLARAANFVQPKKVGDNEFLKDVPPPLDTVRDVQALGPGQWRFPPIEALVDTPVLRPDGSVLSTPGYDSVTRLYLTPCPGLADVSVPESPTAGQVDRSVRIIEDVLNGFPFADAASYANAVGLLITPVVRNAISGNVPLALIDAPQAGTGKSLEAEMGSIVATGRPAAMLSPAREDDEWRKAITSALLAGSTFIVFDNLDTILQAGPLACAITSRSWSDRVLGRSETVELPQRATWIVTGNNIRLGGDLPRRCYQIRLDAQTSRPWQRQGFRHPDLIAWTLENRGSIVAALLTLCRAWHAAGRPLAKSPVIGGFESWSRTIGGILAFAGIERFLANLDALYERADETAFQWEQFLRALGEIFDSAAFGAADVMMSIADDQSCGARALPEELAFFFDPRAEKARSFQSRLGRALRKKLHVRYGIDGIHLKEAPSSGGAGGAGRYLIAVGDRRGDPSAADPGTSETSETFSPNLCAREKKKRNKGDNAGKTSPTSPESPCDPCFSCRATDFWMSTTGVRTCRQCHPPVPGAEVLA